MVELEGINDNDTQSNTYTLGGVEITIDLLWLERAARWLVDVRDRSGAVRHRGIVLAHGVIPIERGNGLPSGDLIVFGPGSVMLRGDLGTRVRIAYRDAS